jgi:hypothetical protein
VLPHPGFSLGDVRIEDVLPAQRALVVAGLIEKPINLFSSVARPEIAAN